MRLLINWPPEPGPEVQLFAAALDRAPSIVWASLEADSGSAQGEGFRLVLDLGDGTELSDTNTIRVTLTDSDGIPLYRSDHLRRCERQLVEVVVGVHPPGGVASYSRGIVRGSANPEETLRGAAAVLPLLIRKAQALPVDGGMESKHLTPNGPSTNPTKPQTTFTQPLARLRGAFDDRFRRTHWQVGVLETPGSVTRLLAGDQRLDVRWLKPPSRACYWADPFPVLDSDGSLWVFVEEFPFREGNGRIVACRYTADGATEIKTVLDDEHHRALPRVQRHDDRWLATVDTCQTPAPVFTFDEIGGPWRPVEGAFLPPYAVDPMLSRSDNGWSVVLTNWTLDEGSACETWRSSSGPPFDWHRDDSSGYVDPERGRGAGQLDADNGMRAVQDCSFDYGMKTSLVSLAPCPDGRPKVLATLLPERLSGRSWENTHTLAWVPRTSSTGTAENSNYVVVDAGWSKVDLAWPFLRKRELRHLKACREASLGSTARESL